MSAQAQVMEKETEVVGKGGGDGGRKRQREEEEKVKELDEEKEFQQRSEQKLVMESAPARSTMVSKLQTHRPVTPIHVFTNAARTREPNTFQLPPVYSQPTPASLNSRRHTNRISLFLFLFHLVAIGAAVGFFLFKAVQGILGDIGVAKQQRERKHLTFWLPPIEGSVVVAVFFAFAWQKALRTWPEVIITFALWFCFASTMAAGILLLCFSMTATTCLGVAFICFSIGNSLYASWVTRRREFAAKVMSKSLQPAHRFPNLNHPTYIMLAVGVVWISLWCFAVIGALNFDQPPLTILAMVLSLMWTAEVMRNVANLTVSRVISLYYLRGMQSDTQISFYRVVTKNLGSACLGSLFVPAIEACRIVARVLNLLEGEDEFMFSCAHCCLRVMEAVFRYGNSWAFVHIAAYGRGFVAASQSTWELFERAGMERLLDSDITSSVCFLSGVSSGSLCAIFAAPWAFSAHQSFTVTVSLIAFFVGYLMTRIGMALPQACVGCYYVCYAENPGIRIYDSTIRDRIDYVNSGQEDAAPTPRFPRRFAPRA